MATQSPSRAELEKALRGMTRLELLEMARASEAAVKKKGRDGPTTDDELHDWVKTNLGIIVPRKAVCEGHNAPFEFLSDLYFERTSSALLMANRGGSKTFLVAVLHLLNSVFKPGVESATVGAIEMQARRAYMHLQKMLERYGQDVVAAAIMSETRFKNGSRVEVLPGTLAAVNGPHPSKVHFDEVELADPEVFQESRNMPLSFDTPVLTPQGWAQIGELSIGDEVIGLDGTATTILDIQDHDDEELFELTLTDKRKITAGKDHLWMTANQYQKKIDAWRVVHTDQLHLGDYLPATPVVHYDAVDLPVDPYVVGVLLGDGSISGTRLSFTTTDKNIRDEVEHRLQGVAEVEGSGPQYRINVGYTQPNLNTVFSTLGLFGTRSQTKFIPEIYLRGSVTERLDLLRGLMDTDGETPRGDSANVGYASTSTQLARDVAELVRSLGGKARIGSRKYKTAWSQGVLHTVGLTLPAGVDPYHTPKKAGRRRDPSRTLCPAIKSIEPVGTGLARCITVDAADGMFLAVDMIPTHNSQSQYLANGMLTASQDIITSTRKRGHGMMQQLLDQIQDAKLNNATPPYELYVWCAYESAVNVPNCVMANPDVENPCPCKDVYGGKWEDGTPRTLADCCKGRLARSDGFVPLGDIINTFTKTSRGIWEAQQECIKPSTEGLILPDFKRETHCVVNWQADPDDGPIFQAVDWGGTNPHGVEWCQLTRREVTAKNIAGEEIRVPEGSIVFFDEIYEAGIGNNALADKVVKRERMWRGKWPRFRISVRFPDPQGKAARLDWAAHDPPLPTKFMATREVEEHIKLAVERVEQGTVFLDAKRTPMLIDEIEAWHYQKPKAGMVDQPIKPVDDFNHAVSAFRYALANIHVMIKNGSIGTGALPKAGEVRSAAASGNETAAGIPTTTGGRLQQGGLGLPDSERWRGAYGPATAWRP